MNIKKSKIALLLGASLFLVMPLSSTFADQNHHDIKVTPMGGVMQNIKSELRGYVKGVKSNDAQKMQQHLDALLKLSAMPAMDHSEMKLDHADMTNEAMATMDHTEMTNEAMAAMDHSKMDHSDMPMDHTDMTTETMATMDHSTMDHSEMQTDHDMSTMSGMDGMSAEQHQHMMYMQEMSQFHDLFKSLDKAKDKAEITVILGQIKEQIKNSNK